MWSVPGTSTLYFPGLNRIDTYPCCRFERFKAAPTSLAFGESVCANIWERGTPSMKAIVSPIWTPASAAAESTFTSSIIPWSPICTPRDPLNFTLNAVLLVTHTHTNNGNSTYNDGEEQVAWWLRHGQVCRMWNTKQDATKHYVMSLSCGCLLQQQM